MIQHFILSIQDGEHWWRQYLGDCRNLWSEDAVTWLPLERGGDLLALRSISSSLLQQRFPRDSPDNFSLEIFTQNQTKPKKPKPTKPFFAIKLFFALLWQFLHCFELLAYFVSFRSWSSSISTSTTIFSPFLVVDRLPLSSILSIGEYRGRQCYLGSPLIVW